MCRVVLVGVPGDDQTAAAHAKLAAVDTIEHTFYGCAPALAEDVSLPFIRDDRGRRYFGVDGVDWFIEQHQMLCADG